MADIKVFERVALTIEKLLGDKNSNAKASKGINLSTLILNASKASNEGAFRQLARIQRLLPQEERKGSRHPQKDFGGDLLSADGMLRTSSTSPWETPAFYPYALDAEPWNSNAFHTNKEMSPWADVILPGVCNVTGVYVENKTPAACYRARQVPIEILVSEDGNNWESILVDKTTRDIYRADVSNKPRKAKYIRVRRIPEVRDDVFHLNKILVYGKRLY